MAEGSRRLIQDWKGNFSIAGASSIFVDKTRAFKHRQSFRFYIGLCFDLRPWSLVSVNYCKKSNNNITSTSGRDGYLRRVHVVTVRDKMCSCEICKAMSIDTSPNQEIPATFVRPCVENIPGT